MTKVACKVWDAGGALADAMSGAFAGRLDRDRLVREMEDSGIILIPGFRSAIAQAATIQADLEVAWADVHKNGRYITSKTGLKKINPAVEDTHKLNEKLMRALYQLGLTPKSIGGNAGKDKDGDGPTLAEILNAS